MINIILYIKIYFEIKKKYIYKFDLKLVFKKKVYRIDNILHSSKQKMIRNNIKNGIGDMPMSRSLVFDVHS